jgi:hypothetical protein
MTSEDEDTSENEGKFDFESYSSGIISNLEFMAKSRRFAKHFPELQQKLRKQIRGLSEGLDEDIEPVSEPNTRADAQRVFNSQSSKLLQRVAATKFGAKFKK